MAILALETGLRESNVTLLRWEQIDLSQRIIYVEGDDILKSEQAFVVPLYDSAVNVIRRQVGNHSERVFTFRGNPIRRANTQAFKNVCAKLGIEDLRWHELRHT